MSDNFLNPQLVLLSAKCFECCKKNHILTAINPSVPAFTLISSSERPGHTQDQLHCVFFCHLNIALLPHPGTSTAIQASSQDPEPPLLLKRVIFHCSPAKKIPNFSMAQLENSSSSSSSATAAVGAQSILLHFQYTFHC